MIEHDLIAEPDSRIWVRLVTVESESPDRVREALEYVTEQMIPSVRDLPGWRGALALASGNGRRGLTMTFWDSVESLRASGRPAEELRDVVGLDLDVDTARFEILLDERPDSA